MVYGTRYWSYSHHHHHDQKGDDDDRGRSDDDSGQDEERYRYRGCIGVLLAMMPSNREPEFLPLPIDGRMVRRKNKSVKNAQEVHEEEEEMDIEAGRKIQFGRNKKPLEYYADDDEDVTEFLIEPKDTNGPLVGRANRSRK